MPANTSPDPPVASQGGAFSAMDTRPSGAATTLSAPFSRTVAPESAEARPTSSYFDDLSDGSALYLNSRTNSPSCGVRIVADRLRLIAENSVSGLSAKLVRASASSATAHSDSSAARTISRSAGPTPPPGPSTIALSLRSPSSTESPAASSTWRTMMDRLAAALTASASAGMAIVTRPAPALKAPRAASRAAPVEANPPDTTTA